MSKEAKRRSESAGIINFSREMISALFMAFVFIVYVIQAFKIPTGSMEKSLLVGDFLLGLKFVYGAPVLPFSYAKFPGVQKPTPGDVMIFKYPGSDRKDYIKRCVAGPGQTIRTEGQKLFVDGKERTLAPRGKYVRQGQLGPGIANFKTYRIPAKGDTLVVANLQLREFLFTRSIIHQENRIGSIAARVENTPFLNKISGRKWHTKVEMKFPIYINGSFHSNANIPNEEDIWVTLNSRIKVIERELLMEFGDSAIIEIQKEIYISGEKVDRYIVRHNNYFMMGDNRDNSADSRYWGPLNFTYIKAKAFILYLSLSQYYEDNKYEPKLKSMPIRYPDTKQPVRRTDPANNVNMILTQLQMNNLQWEWNFRGELMAGVPKPIPLYLFIAKIRWNRFGKLIRSWDGFEDPKKTGKKM